MPYLLIIAISAVFLVGTASAAPVNEWCPVTPDEPAESHLTVEFEGQTIGFCCRACVRKFLADPELYRTNLPHFAPAYTEPASTPAAEQGQPAELTDTSLAGRIWRLLGNLHILAVHFPVALLLLAAPLEAAAVLRGSAKFAFAARVNFVVGAVAAITAAALGWIAAANIHYTGDAADLLEWHRWLGTSLAIVAVAGGVALIFEFRGHRGGTPIFRATLILLLLLIPLAAHFGGSLVYGPNHLAF